MTERRIVPISALQHFAYCPRQCALIHIEQTFDENIFTLRGQRAHKNVHQSSAQTEGTRQELRGLPLWSERLGLIGVADVVEIDEAGIMYPVEHKVGRRKARDADDVQVCAQALCLEEMTGGQVPRGAIFHHASRRRREVEFDVRLRTLTLEIVEKTRSALGATRLPAPVADARCQKCSLLEACMPFEVARLSPQVPENDP